MSTWIGVVNCPAHGSQRVKWIESEDGVSSLP